MTIETWDRQPLREQEAFVGRTKGDGRAAVGRRRSSPSPTSTMPGRDDQPVIADGRPRARWSTPTHNGGARMLRRGYNFVDGSDALGRLDAGLFFIAYVRDPRHPLHPDADRDGEGRRPDASTSSTPARRCSPCRRGSARASTSVRRCSPEASRGSRAVLPPGRGARRFSHERHSHARRRASSRPAGSASRPPASRSSTSPSGPRGPPTCSGRGSRPTCRCSASATARSSSTSASPSGRRVVVTVVGIVVSFALCGVIAIAGKRGSAPTMILSRAAFGVNGQKVPGVDLVAGLDRLGDVPRDPRGARDRRRSSTSSAGAAAPAPRSSPPSSWPRLIVVGQRRRLPHHHADAVGADLDHRHRHHRLHGAHARRDRLVGGAARSRPASTQPVIGALVMVMTGFGLGWINIAADWSRYQHRDASGRRRSSAGTPSAARVAPVLLVLFGLAARRLVDRAILDGVVADPIGTLAHPAADLVPRAVPARRDPRAGQRRGARHLLLRPDAALASACASRGRRRRSSTA